MDLKASRYNFFWKSRDPYYLAYNAITNTFGRVKEEDYPEVQAIIENPNAPIRDAANAKRRSDLFQGGFLIAQEIDEVSVLKMKNRMGRFSTDYFGLTIAPTLDCNFRCTYCFEEHKKEKMSQEIEAALLTYVDKQIKYTRGFSVTWFGGEPMLCMDIIQRLTKGFSELCAKHNVEFSPSSIITNGYFLTQTNAQILKDLNIRSAQVTIDGPREVHDARRKHLTGKGTYDRVMENIKASMDLIQIQIRVNIDLENSEEIDRLFMEINEYGLNGKVHVYFGRVIASTDACANVASKCFSVKHFSAKIIESMDRNGINGLTADYPMPFDYGVCCADKTNAFVVTPTGRLFKCWSETSFDDAHSVGSIFNESLSPTNIVNMTKYMNWDPFEQKDCTECVYLPICGGGCPYNGIAGEDRCTTWKYYLEDMLEKRYAEIVSRS